MQGAGGVGGGIDLLLDHKGDGPQFGLGDTQSPAKVDQAANLAQHRLDELPVVGAPEPRVEGGAEGLAALQVQDPPRQQGPEPDVRGEGVDDAVEISGREAVDEPAGRSKARRLPAGCAPAPFQGWSRETSWLTRDPPSASGLHRKSERPLGRAVPESPLLCCHLCRRR